MRKTTKSPGEKMRLIVRSTKAALMSLEHLEAVFTGTSDISLWAEEPTSDEEELGKRVSNARRMAKKLENGRNPPRGQDEVRRVSNPSERFVRDPNVVAWVLEEASGLCEVCGEKAPFEREDGEPYLEVHHVRPLAEGGPDRVDNAVACCPNCHRKLHHGADRLALRQRVCVSLDRLKDWPIQSVAPSDLNKLS